MKSKSADMIDRLKLYLGVSADNELAAKLGVTPPTVSGWRSRGTVPIQHFLEIANREPIDLNWLLLGEGQMARPRAGSLAVATKSSLRETHRAAEAAATEDLGLGTVASLARLGTAGGEWRLLEVLLRHPPEGVELEELARELGDSLENVSAYATLLVQLGEGIETDGRLQLRAFGEISDVRSRGLPDRHQHALTATSYILRRVLPAIEEKRGILKMKQGRVGAGAATELLTNCVDCIDNLVEEAAREPGEEDGFTIILAVVAEPGNK